MHNFLNHLHLVAREPLTYVAFIVLVGAWLLRAYFLHTKSYANTIKGVPARDRLSALQLLVLGYPEKVTANHLRVIQQRYLLFAFIATLVSVLALSGLVIYYWSLPLPHDIYRVMVKVTDSQGRPVADAKVTSSVSENGKQQGSVWQFDIPVSAKPGNGVVTFDATKEFLKGSGQVTLAQDFNPGVAIKLVHDETARAMARVVDKNGKLVKDAVVWVERYEHEKTQITDGYFDLPSHHATGERVMMFVARPNQEPEKHWLEAGDSKAEIKLQN
jgi:hypothetical protein